MGDPKTQKKKYSTPRHPWIKAKIEEEKPILIEYGLKNKKEIYKQSSVIKNIKDNVKRLNAGSGAQVDIERNSLVAKLRSLNLLKEDESLDIALNLTPKDIMERRLQTQLVRQNLAKTFKQARQFIVHGHIKVNGKKITAPSYTLSREEQFKIEFIPSSTLADANHPERKAKEVEPKLEEKKVKTEEELLAEEVEKDISAKLSSKEATLSADGAVTEDEDG
jgi:small subunit ribosomal protein S4